MTKELKALEQLKYYNTLANDDFDMTEELSIIETALKKQEQDQKELKALEIIKEKRVNVGDFARCKNVEDYNDYCCYSEKEQLTQEEYDLLKEVLL